MNTAWKYYNHALIPTAAPHEDVDTSEMKNKGFWKYDGKHKPLLARWTTDFDCGHETNWWYVIRDGEFELSELSSHTRKHVKQSLKKTYVKKLDHPEQWKEQLYQCYQEAFERYKNVTITISDFEKYSSSIDSRKKNEVYWAAFEQGTEHIVGYMICTENSTWTEINVAKYSTKYMNLRASDALHYTVIDYYLNQKGNKYITSGSRTINHETNTQQYKIDTFGFRKAYCKLHIAYPPSIAWIVSILMWFRKPLKKHDDKKIIHLINSVLDMQALVEK